MTKKCASCGELNSDDSAFCNNCGEKKFEENAVITCSVCRQKIGANSVFCPNCGEVLKEESAALPQSFNPATLSPKIQQAETGGGIMLPQEQPQKQEVEQREEAIICGVCGQTLSESDVFCIRCGSDVTGQANGRLTKKKICPHCKGINAMSAVNCTFCFYSLEGADFDEFLIEHQKAEEEDGLIIAVLKSSTNKKSRLCPECGTANDLNKKFCVKCGMRLAVFLHKKYCYLCGAENAYDAEYCNRCRYSFTKKDKAEEELFRCKCGHLNEKTSAFCTKCGVKLSK